MRYKSAVLAGHCRWALSLAVFLSLPAFGTGRVDSAETILTSDEQLHLGGRIYRDGLGSDNQAIQAIVAGDVTVDGRMFTCVNCHQRSGLGSVEGAVVTWPVTGKELFVPRRRTGAWNPVDGGQRSGAIERKALPTRFRAAQARPAYTAETLAKAIRTGIAADGRILSSVMPRYSLADEDMASLVYYLKNLSVVDDPGVNDKTMRFATVVTDGVSDENRDAMLNVLQNHIDVHNVQTRPHSRRARQSPFYKSENYGAYRTFLLDVWHLNGSPDTWRAQLETYYQTQPVFALLGGIGSGSWAPVHAFSEDMKIPAILPITDYPVVSDTDWYTLYFSKGFYQEGEAAARYLGSTESLNADSRIIQVYRQGSDGEAIAHGFETAWMAVSGQSVENLVLAGDKQLNWPQNTHNAPPLAILFWLGTEELVDVLHSKFVSDSPASMLFGSASLLEDELQLIPGKLRDRVYLTKPSSLPDDNKYRRIALQQWLKIRGIPATNLDIQSRMFFLGWILPGAIAHMRGDFHRDYFLESFDMMTDQDTAIAIYPRLSFGPGQRYASKGCYITQLDAGEKPRLTKVSNWATK